MVDARNPTTSHRNGPPLKPLLARSPHTSVSISPSTTTTSLRPKLSHRPPSSAPSDAHTRPSTQDTSSHLAPRLVTRKSRLDNPTSSPADETPSHAKKRPLMISPTNSEPAVRRPQTLNTTKARSYVGTARPVAGNAPRTAPAIKPTVRGFVKTPDTAKSSPSTLHPHIPNAPPSARPPSAKNANDKDSPSMFFHASDAKSRPSPQERPTQLKKAPSFFYANAQQHELSPKPFVNRSPSPVLSTVSAVSESHSPRLFVQSPPSTNNVQIPQLLSPPLSAVSATSNHVPSPNSPPKNNIHLSYRKGASQIFGLGGPPLPFNDTQRKTSSSSVRPSHLRTSSLSSIDTGSPEHTRRQSHPLPKNIQLVTNGQSSDSPLTENITPSHDAEPSPSSDTVQEPEKLSIDVHADARRERKVLDLEISNSSLLAINKSLEREIRKQKAELKRFRRLSRAGQLPIPQRQSSADSLPPLDEEDDLPEFDLDNESARPSSPFQDHPSEDSSDDESNVSSVTPLSPGAQAARDAARRAEDENRLRLDLSKHRELLLDTQRMNQSLQRCLYWTEGLIKDGRKALEYQVASSDVRLGGHILSVDDLDDSSQVDNSEDVHDHGEPFDGEMDSGIDLEKRGVLTMAMENPHHKRPAQEQ